MNNQYTQYTVRTEERTYNAVASVYNFCHRVRPNWNDFSQVLTVSGWSQERQQWETLEPMEWVQNYQ